MRFLEEQYYSVPDEACPHSYLAVTDGLHDGVEPTGREIVSYLESEPPISGLMLVEHMHPEAVQAGVRYLGNGELGGKFTEDIRCADPSELDRDERYAWAFMRAPMPHIWLGIDPHDSPALNANALIVSQDFYTFQLGVAAVMGLQKVVMLPEYPFLRMYRNFVSVETTRDVLSNPLSSPKFWRRSLKRMVELGPRGMSELGMNIYGELDYYQKLELVRTDEAGNPDPKEIARISTLEGSPTPGPYFTMFDKSHPLFNAYPGIRHLCGRIAVGYWDDNNNAKECSDTLGFRRDGRPRRVAFGSLLLRVPVSELTTELIKF